MIEPTLLSDSVVPADFIAKAIKATTSSDIKGLHSELPVVPDDDYAFTEESPEKGWQPGKFHWVPVGRHPPTIPPSMLARTRSYLKRTSGPTRPS